MKRGEATKKGEREGRRERVWSEGERREKEREKECVCGWRERGGKQERERERERKKECVFINCTRITLNIT